MREHNLDTEIGRLRSFDSWHPDPCANYGGSDRKDGLLDDNGARYMVKFSEKQAPRNDFATSYVNNVVSEYMCSHIFGILGYPVHDTELGTLNGEIVVACKNFVKPGTELIEFEKFLRKHYDSGDIGRIPNINHIYSVLETDRILSPQADRFKAVFWDRFVGDALVGNFDRHKGNFGYLVKMDGSVEASPIYDNGSTLFPNLSEDGMKTVIQNPKEIMQRIKLFPKAALELHANTKVDYYDMMFSGIYSDLTAAVIRMVPRMQESMPAVTDFINNCGFLSGIRKNFYNVMLAERMHFILEPAYERCVVRNFDQNARNRVENGVEYGKDDFESYWERAQSAVGSEVADVRDNVILHNSNNTHAHGVQDVCEI